MNVSVFASITIVINFEHRNITLGERSAQANWVYVCAEINQSQLS